MLRLFIKINIILWLVACTALMSENKAQIAEELTRQKKYAEAIEIYRQHMQERLELKNRPEWENPYFYLILIGDIQLGTGDIPTALTTFLEADAKAVDRYLISDRIRGVAKAYEQNKQIDQAIELLLAHRERDPLLFDVMLDRLNKIKTLSES